MWTACDDCAAMRLWHHLVSQSLSRWTWDLRVPTLCIFPSIFIILHANTSLAAPQGLYVYLFSIPTQRPIVCALVPCSHPHPLHPHADSCPSYRHPPVSHINLARNNVQLPTLHLSPYLNTDSLFIQGFPSIIQQSSCPTQMPLDPYLRITQT